ncbi:amino acid transporter AVT1J-like [Ixodes scapularis]|uniref:amino acid transporter AVT1J-like n=1 Tax=Ixodes scapularis TaxID=6945 RepID=UPI001A9F5E94|nr:amino acid transporter AVT1J-like [Ixodes scapularis]
MGESAQCPSAKGLSQWLAVIFVIGAVAGIGTLALPYAMNETGWSGTAIIVVCALASGYGGSRLGLCWIILEERWLEYREANRNPYPCIAFRAYGKPMKIAMSLIQLLSLFGYGTVFLLLAGELISDLTRQLSHDTLDWSICYWLIPIAVVLGGLMWLGTPKDFGFAAFGALGTILLASFMVVGVCCSRILGGTAAGPRRSELSVGGFFRGFGTIMFSYSGASMFPTVQNDMKDTSRFSGAVVYATIALVLLYLLLSLMGFLTFGSDVQANILLSIGDGVTSIVVQCLFIVHLICGFLILINPMCQELEEHIGVPPEFTWKRAASRSFLMLAVLVVAESVPQFGKVLPLVGSVVAGLTTFILPCVFYYKLCSDTKREWPERKLPLWEKSLIVEIVIVGVIGTVAGTVSSIQDLLAPGSFALPCFISTDVVI